MGQKSPLSHSIFETSAILGILHKIPEILFLFKNQKKSIKYNFTPFPQINFQKLQCLPGNEPVIITAKLFSYLFLILHQSLVWTAM